MDEFLREKKDKKGLNNTLLVSGLIGVLLIGGAIGLISLIPPIETNRNDVLIGAFTEGSPEFDDYTKEIVVTTDTDRLMQSMTGLGKITMHVGGSIYNKGDKTLTALQVNVGVIDSESKVIKEKKFILFPNSRRSTLDPGKTINVNVNLGGFAQDDDRANVRWKVTALKLRDYSP